MMERTNITLTNNTITVCNNNTDYPKTTALILHYQTHYYTLTKQIFIYMAGALLSIITILGNVLVCVAYYSNRRLQTITNLFICSLAVTDIAVGVVSVNLYTLYIVLKRWPLGPVICDIWLCLDYSLCQVSIAHLVIICLDRYCSIRRPIKYRAKRTKHRAKIAILLGWIISFSQWAPWIVSYPFIKGERTVDVEHCYVQFLFENPYITIITATAAYFIPVLVMGAAYVHIYILIFRNEKIYNNMKVTFKKKRIHEELSVQYSSNSTTSMTTASSVISVIDNQRHSSSQVVTNRYNESIDEKKDKKLSFGRLSFFVKQKKLTKILVLTFVAFLISWIPYFVVSVWAPFCKDCIPDYAWDCCYMMCYINSTINPLCYALGSKEFKRTFKKLLSVNCRRVENCPR